MGVVVRAWALGGVLFFASACGGKKVSEPCTDQAFCDAKEPEPTPTATINAPPPFAPIDASLPPPPPRRRGDVSYDPDAGVPLEGIEDAGVGAVPASECLARQNGCRHCENCAAEMDFSNTASDLLKACKPVCGQVTIHFDDNGCLAWIGRADLENSAFVACVVATLSTARFGCAAGGGTIRWTGPMCNK